MLKNNLYLKGILGKLYINVLFYERAQNFDKRTKNCPLINLRSAYFLMDVPPDTPADFVAETRPGFAGSSSLNPAVLLR